MTASLKSLEATIGEAELIEQLLAIGTALSGKRDLGELLNLILEKSLEITCSDAGSVYLVDRNGEEPVLWFKAAQNFSRPSVCLHEFSVPLTQKSLAGYVALTGRCLNIPDAYDLPPEFPYQLDRSFDQSIGYRTRSVLLLPMQNQEQETIGVLQLINRKFQPDTIVTPENVLAVTQPFSDWEKRVVRSLASQAAISIERNQLQESIEHLFEGFVKASVQVIEARDPTTSGHSERVADLTVRLAEETSTITQGCLREVCFNDRQIQEIRYAALLHDFGKVGVPEAVLGKQKKLYPLQLEVLRNRFALVRRTLEMNCAQDRFRHLVEHPRYQNEHRSSDCSHCQRLAQLDDRLAQAIDQLEDYWEVLLAANEPQILAEEPLTRLKELAQYTYQDVDGERRPLISPEELSQLMVSRGSLTVAEREAIQSHVTHTYEFPASDSVDKAAPGCADHCLRTPRKAGWFGLSPQLAAAQDLNSVADDGDRGYLRCSDRRRSTLQKGAICCHGNQNPAPGSRPKQAQPRID